MRTANTANVCDALIQRLFSCHGVAEVLVADNGSQFTSRAFKQFCDTYHIKLHLISYYRPQNNLTERYNQTIFRSIAMYCQSSHRVWADYLPHITFAINTSVNKGTSFSPARLVYGRELRSYFEVEAQVSNGQVAPFNALEYEGRLRSELNDAMDRVKVYAKHIKSLERKQYNLRRRDVSYAVGDLVFKTNHQQSDKAQFITKKFLPLYEGPFVVSEVINRREMILSRLSDGKCVGRWHVDNLKPVIT